MINGLYLEPYQNVSKDDVLNCHANGEAIWVKADPLGIDLECSYCGYCLDEDTPVLLFCPHCKRKMLKYTNVREGFLPISIVLLRKSSILS